MNPRTVLAVSRFQGECIRPLCHATADKRNGGGSVTDAEIATTAGTFECRPRGMEIFGARAVRQTRPRRDGKVATFSPWLIRRQFSPSAAICGRDSWLKKCAFTYCPYVAIA